MFTCFGLLLSGDQHDIVRHCTNETEVLCLCHQTNMLRIMTEITCLLQVALYLKVMGEEAMPFLSTQTHQSAVLESLHLDIKSMTSG